MRLAYFLGRTAESAAGVWVIMLSLVICLTSLRQKANACLGRGLLERQKWGQSHKLWKLILGLGPDRNLLLLHRCVTSTDSVPLAQVTRNLNQENPLDAHRCQGHAGPDPFGCNFRFAVQTAISSKNWAEKKRFHLVNFNFDMSDIQPAKRFSHLTTFWDTLFLKMVNMYAFSFKGKNFGDAMFSFSESKMML